MGLTEKQKSVLSVTIREPCRWNISVGAVRSGKTYLDYYRIPNIYQRPSGRYRHSGQHGGKR